MPMFKYKNEDYAVDKNFEVYKVSMTKLTTIPSDMVEPIVRALKNEERADATAAHETASAEKGSN